MEITFFSCGYGSPEDACENLYDNGKYVLICDDDAANVGATDCWFAAQITEKCKHTDIVHNYESSGGTVSATYNVEIKGIDKNSKYPTLYKTTTIE